MTELKKLLGIAGITLTVYLSLKYLLPYVIPFLFAYILVHLLNPLTDRIRKKLPWKKEIIVSFLLILFLAAFLFLFYWVYCLLMEQIRKIALNFDYYYSSFCRWIDGCCRMAEQNFGIRVDEVRAFVYSGLNQTTEQIRVYIVPEILNHSMKYLKKLFDLGLFLLILFISVILLMKDYDKMKESLQKYSLYLHFHNITDRIWKQGGMYMKAQGIIILVVTILCTVGLWALGNPYFLLLGIIIGLVDVLPFIGTGTVLIPVAVFQVCRGEFRLAAGYAGLFLLTYIVREFMEPRLLGAKLGVYPFAMVAVIYAGLYLYGTAGVLLGPVTLLAVKEIYHEMQPPL